MLEKELVPGLQWRSQHLMLLDTLGNLPIGKLVRNRWVRLAVLDPATAVLSVFQGGVFRPYTPQSGILPKAKSSVDWYRGWRDHLDFAEIRDARLETAGSWMVHRDD